MIGTSEHLGIHAGQAVRSPPAGMVRRLHGLATPTLGAGLLALIVYGLTIQTRDAHIDEYYHLLAARSWQQDGSFAILDGVYNRAKLFTILVGTSFDLFGRSDLLIARVPSVICSAASVAIIFLWLRRTGSIWGAPAAALLFGLAGYTFDVAHFARFYAPHCMLILGGAGAVFAATRTKGLVQLAWSSLALLCLALAMHLQPVTAIAVAGLGAWLVFDQHERLTGMVQDRRLPMVMLLSAALIGAAALAWLFGERALTSFRHAERWASGSQDDPLYYLREFWAQMPLMTLLSPVALLLAWRRQPALAALCAFMVGLCLTLHSFAGMKAWRYAYYVFPFLCMGYGLALDSLVAGRSGRQLLLPGVALLVLLASSPLYRHSIRLLAASLPHVAADPASVAGPVPDGSWGSGSAPLRRLAAGEPLVVTGDDLRTLAHVGRFELFISHSRLGELDPPTDFNRDFRTGRPLIDSGQAMRTVIDCNGEGLVIVSDRQWRSEMGVRNDVADVIEGRAQPVRAASGFHVFRWRHRPLLGTCPYAQRPPRPAAFFSTTRKAPPFCQPRGLSRQSCPYAPFGIAAGAAVA